MATIDQLSNALINADKAGDIDAARALATEIKRLQSTQPNAVVDAAKSFGVGMAKGALGGLAGPRQLISAATDYVANKVGADPDKVEQLKSAAQQVASVTPLAVFARAPALSDVQPEVEKATGKFYEPKTTVGHYANAAGEMAGNPLSYVGPGGALLKAGGAIVAGLGGEGGKQAAAGTGYEGAAQLAGALAGGAAAARVLGPVQKRAEIPQYRELKDAASADYNAARNSGLTLDPRGTSNLASRIEQELSGPNHGFTGGQYGDAPKAFAILDTLQNPPNGAVVTASNLDAVRKNLGRLSRETRDGKHTPDAAAASVILENFNSYLENIPRNHILAGSATDYLRATQRGNANYAAAQRVRAVDTKLARAENNADGGIATQIDNQIKSQLRTLLNNPKSLLGFSEAEVAAIESLNKGSLASNTLRQLGRGGAGVIPMAMHAAAAVPAAAATGGASILPQVLLGAGLYGARKTAEGMTKRGAERLAEMIAKRSPEYERRAARVPKTDTTPNKAALIRALLASH